MVTMPNTNPAPRWLRVGWSIFPMDRVTEIRALPDGEVQVFVQLDLLRGSDEPTNVAEGELAWVNVEEHHTLLGALTAAARYADEYDDALAAIGREGGGDAE